MRTKFAPAERLPVQDIQAMSEKLSREVLLSCLDRVPMGVLVLDQHRQIVFSNAAFNRLAHKHQTDQVLGQRPGEALDCIHAQLEPGGCGCSDFCQLCGAAQAILKSLQGDQDCQECRLLRLLEGAQSVMDLQIFTSPFTSGGATFSLVTILDISHEKRLRYLERTFLHNLVDLAGGMAGLAEILEMEAQGDEVSSAFAQSSKRLLNEVMYHRDLAAAEDGKLQVSPEVIALPEFLGQLGKSCCDHVNIHNVPVRLDLECLSIIQDRRILRHVLRNMLVNAIEACSSDQGEVLLSCRRRGEGVSIRVENPGELPPEVQGQLFKRYVSSKGPDRGLGLYVMRLFAEKHLGGRLAVSSAQGRTAVTLEL